MEESRRTTPAFCKCNCTETPVGAIGPFPTYFCRECGHGLFTEIHECGLRSRLLECANCGHSQNLPSNHLIHLVTKDESIEDFNKRISDHLDNVQSGLAQKLEEELTSDFKGDTFKAMEKIAEAGRKLGQLGSDAMKKNFEQFKEVADTLIPKPTVGRIVHVFPGDRWQLPKGVQFLAAIVMVVNDLYITCAAFVPPTPHNIFQMQTLPLWEVPHESQYHTESEPYWVWPPKS